MSKSVEERLAAIHRALAHQLYYNGDIGADLRWLLGGYELLQNHTKHQKADYDSLAAKLDAADREVARLLQTVTALEQENRALKAKLEPEPIGLCSAMLVSRYGPTDTCVLEQDHDGDHQFEPIG